MWLAREIPRQRECGPCEQPSKSTIYSSDTPRCYSTRARTVSLCSPVSCLLRRCSTFLAGSHDQHWHRCLSNHIVADRTQPHRFQTAASATAQNDVVTVVLGGELKDLVSWVRIHTNERLEARRIRVLTDDRFRLCNETVGVHPDLFHLTNGLRGDGDQIQPVLRPCK